MTIDGIKKKYNEWLASQKAIEDKLQNLANERNELERQKTEAMEVEDGKAYIKIKHALEDNEAATEILKHKKTKGCPISAEDLASAWENYTAEFAGKRTKLEASVNADLEKLGEDVRQISLAQREAFAAREYLAGLAKVESFEKKRRFPLRLYILPRFARPNDSAILGIAVKDHDQEKELILSGFSLLE